MGLVARHDHTLHHGRKVQAVIQMSISIHYSVRYDGGATHMFDTLKIACAAKNWEVIDAFHGKAEGEEVAVPAFEVEAVFFVEVVVSFGIGLLASSEYGRIQSMFRLASHSAALGWLDGDGVSTREKILINHVAQLSLDFMSAITHLGNG